jgi:hypothetical protein
MIPIIPPAAARRRILARYRRPTTSSYGSPGQIALPGSPPLALRPHPMVRAQVPVLRFQLARGAGQAG